MKLVLMSTSRNYHVRIILRLEELRYSQRLLCTKMSIDQMSIVEIRYSIKIIKNDSYPRIFDLFLHNFQEKIILIYYK